MKKILLLLIGCFSLIVFAEKPLPVETFFKNPQFGSLRISPDGKHFAATVLYKDKMVLAILDAKTSTIKTVIPMAQDKREIGEFGWLNNERVYAEMVARVGPLAEARPTGYLFASNINGKKRVQLLPSNNIPGQPDERPRYFSIVNRLKDDERRILISMSDAGFNTIYKLNVYTGRRVPVDKAPAKNTLLYPDYNGNVRVAFETDNDDEKVRIYLRKDNQKEWYVFKEFDKKNLGIKPLAITLDQQHLLIDGSDENNQNVVYKLNLFDKKFEKIKVLDGDASITSTIRFYNKEYGAYSIVGVRQVPGFVRSTFFDDNSEAAQLYNQLSSIFPDQEVRILNTTDSGKHSLVAVWSDRNPGTFFLFDHKKNNLNYLLDLRPNIDPEQMAAMEPVSFKARDGMEIRGYLSRPLGVKQNLPMIVMVHGGPYGESDTWGFNRETQFFANRGYAVLQINFRGSGGRGGSFEYDAYRQIGAEMQDDLTDGTLWAIENGIADKDRVCIYGTSYGGYAAMMGVVKEPDLYQCAIAYVGVYDIAIQTEESDTADSEYGRRFLVDAWNAYDESFVRERSPIYHLDKLKAAVMLVHGKDDPRVPIEQYDALAEALDDINYPYESIVKAFEGHGFRNEQNNYELYSKIEKFLEKHIGQ
jgi:dipeptidyl aminopeptidase/acylaminoacyl peptidase